MIVQTRFSKFIDKVVAFKKKTYANRMSFAKSFKDPNAPPKVKAVPKPKPDNGITKAEHDTHEDAANAHLDNDPSKEIRKGTDFTPYGKAAPPLGQGTVNQFLQAKGHDDGSYEKLRDSRKGQKDHLLSILNNTHYFFGARVKKEDQAKVDKENTGLSDEQIEHINGLDHGLNNSQLHALLYLDSHDILKDAPPVISDRYQQSRYFDMMREEIAKKQAASGKQMLDENGKEMVDAKGNPIMSPEFKLDKKSLGGIHARVRKSLLPELEGEEDEYASDKKLGAKKLTEAQKMERFPPIMRGLIKGAAAFVGLLKNKRPKGGISEPMVPEGENGQFTNEQLLALDKELNHSGGYSPSVNANFTRMWHAVMHQEVWDLIDGTKLGEDAQGKEYSPSEKKALYHSQGARGVLEKLAQEKISQIPEGTDPKEAKKRKAKIEEDRMRAVVALGLTFATDHTAQALASEGVAKTSSGHAKDGGFVILPSGEWKQYKDEAAKNQIVKENNAGQDSGALWYDDDMAQTDANIVGLLNFLNKGNQKSDKNPDGYVNIPKIEDTIPPTDKGVEQHLMLTNFKALMAPTSFGMQPGANLGVAVKMYKQALLEKAKDPEGKDKSVFAYISTKQDESTDKDGVEHIQHENRLYGRAKALSNSMKVTEPSLFVHINNLYADAENKDNIKKAIYLQKEWMRLQENRDIIYQESEKPRLRPKQKKPKEGEPEQEKPKLVKMIIRGAHSSTDSLQKIIEAAQDKDFKVPTKIVEDDLDITVKGALKKPSLTALGRNAKLDDKLIKMNDWADPLKTENPDGVYTPEYQKKMREDVKNMQFSTEDLQKDWTTRGGSINPMLRFIKNYTAAFGKDGDKQLAAFLTGSHSAKFMAQEWAKYSLHTDENGRNSYQVEIEQAKKLPKAQRDNTIKSIKEDYADFLRKTEKKFISAAPAGLKNSITSGQIGVSGSYIFGPKGGNFHQDLSYQGGYPTKDLWYTRWMLWGLGTMTNKKGSLIDTPPKELAGAFDLVNHYTAQQFNLSNKQVQAMGWYHWKNFCTRMGVKTAGMENYTSASKKIYEKTLGEEADKNIMPEIPKGAANAYAKTKSTEQTSNGKGVSPNFSAANLARANALLGIDYTDTYKKPTRLAGSPGNPLKNSKGKRGTRLPGRNGRRLKFAQFTQAPGGMTGTPVATRTNQPFSNAVAKSPGGKNLAQGALGNQINAKGGVNTTAQNAVGDWPNGSEESIVHTAPQGTDPARLKYLGAWHGISGQKKSVLVFHPNPKGPDSLYHMVHPSTDMGEVREQLIAAGINYKTLLPGKTNTRVVVYDPNRAMRNTIDQFATNNNLNVEENIGQGEIVGHNGDWNSAGALPKSRQAYTNIIGEYEQNSNQAGPANNTSGAPTNGTSTSTGKAQQLSRKTTAKTKIKFDRSRRVLEGFLRQHNTPNKELPPVGDLLSQDLQNIKPEHLSKYQQLIPDAKWSDIEGAVTSLQKDPSLYDDMTSESNRREMYCKEHARTVLQSSGLKKLIDSLRVQNLIPEHAQHLIEDAKDGDYFSLEAISSELQHSVPSLRAFSKAAEKEYNKAGKAWDKMRTGPQPQKFAKKSAHAKDQYRAGAHGITFRGRNYNGGQFAPQNDGVKRFEKDSNVTAAIKKLRGV